MLNMLINSKSVPVPFLKSPSTVTLFNDNDNGGHLWPWFQSKHLPPLGLLFVLYEGTVIVDMLFEYCFVFLREG